MTKDEEEEWLKSEFNGFPVKELGGKDEEIKSEVSMIGGKPAARMIERKAEVFQSHVWECKDHLESNRTVFRQGGCYVQGPRSRKDIGLTKDSTFQEDIVKSWI